MQLVDSTDHPFAQAILKDVADEERGHAGQFLKLLYHLAPDEEKLYQKGAK
jgi:rubrerythrin